MGTNKAEEYADNKYTKQAKEYAITSSIRAIYENCIIDFKAGYNSRQSEIDELTKSRDNLKKQNENLLKIGDKDFVSMSELMPKNDELTKEVERLRNKQQLAIDSLLKIRTDIFDNSSDQMLVKFGVNKIDTLLHQLTNP